VADTPQTQSSPRRIRWWPAAAICLIVLARVLWARLAPDLNFQQRNLQTGIAVLAGGGALGLWWLFLSRLRWRLRLLGVGICLMGLLVLVVCFRIRGVSGDLLPIVEFRWRPGFVARQSTNVVHGLRYGPSTNGAWFPQFLGPNRDGRLPGPRLETNWTAYPPQILWRQSIGAAWSGFAVACDYAITQEQRGEQECVVAYELKTGRPLWVHQHSARFNTKIAGEGPRTTPTIAGNRVLAMGATGMLTCLDFASGQMHWAVDVLATTGSSLPSWGTASSPLVTDKLVVVHSGKNSTQSLHAFSIEDGKQPVWSAGNTSPGYASPILATLAGVPQILAFNSDLITSHDPASGKVLWSHPWGNGNDVCSSPIVVSSNRVLVASGYGYGAELIEVTDRNGKLSATRVWKSPRLKSKFGHLFVRDGCAMGLDDGMFAAIDLADGSLRWKEGRYGHGQGLLVGELYLLMAESGELVLLQPTRAAPNELARFRVFNAKTWNPIALVDDLLLVRNDQEAAGIRLAVARPVD